MAKALTAPNGGRDNPCSAARSAAMLTGNEMIATDGGDCRCCLVAPLFAATLDRHAVRSEIDGHALRRMAVLIELIAQHADGDHQGADDEIENVVARHGCSPLPVSKFR